MNNALTRSNRKLTSLYKKSGKAVDVVSRTVDNLNSINEEITVTTGEIDEHIKQLNVTRTRMNETFKKNGKVIENFKRLLEID